MTPVRVLAVASEVYPIVKTGGLADVVQGDHENREGYRVALGGALSK